MRHALVTFRFSSPSIRRILLITPPISNLIYIFLWPIFFITSFWMLALRRPPNILKARFLTDSHLSLIGLPKCDWMYD